MTETEITARLVEFTNILLAGITVYFTIVSGYVAAMNYFLGASNFLARVFAYMFVSVVMGMLIVVMLGAQHVHEALIAELDRMAAENTLGPVGFAALGNSLGTTIPIPGMPLEFSIDYAVRIGVYLIFIVTYLVLFHMTFLHKWRRDVTPVEIVRGPS
jgi:hypothetical protein